MITLKSCQHFVLAIMLALMLALSGCETMPRVKSLEDSIAVASASITSAATEVQAMCGNVEPGGPCHEDALISTATKERWKGLLTDALDDVELANNALNANNRFDASDYLSRAEGVIKVVQAEITRRGGNVD